ncbi:hypothetical protein Nepgr_000029 [Nepenthes gracilis]|uniref:Uncharacterized protein n=1 Tax=Nepenthes gracilis TaxID=150966 RepID=A0AAD3RWA9_NEPGR|nr:hypothetical protein Nepgr_000029 [Nepenthes gracilis]
MAELKNCEDSKIVCYVYDVMAVPSNGSVQPPGVEETASPSLSPLKIEGAYIPINHLEEAWDESGCIMWDLPIPHRANQYPESLIGANLVPHSFQVLSSLLIVQWISGIISHLGIIGNLVCHEALITQIISTRGLMETGGSKVTIIDQVFLDATTVWVNLLGF